MEYCPIEVSQFDKKIEQWKAQHREPSPSCYPHGRGLRSIRQAVGLSFLFHSHWKLSGSNGDTVGAEVKGWAEEQSRVGFAPTTFGTKTLPLECTTGNNTSKRMVKVRKNRAFTKQSENLAPQSLACPPNSFESMLPVRLLLVRKQVEQKRLKPFRANGTTKELKFILKLCY